MNEFSQETRRYNKGVPICHSRAYNTDDAKPQRVGTLAEHDLEKSATGSKPLARLFLPLPASPCASSCSVLRLGHVAVVVPSLADALARWQEVLQRSPSPCQTLEEHGVRLAFFDLDNTRLELLEPFGDSSELASFLAKHPHGGIHHICFETQSLETLHARLKQNGLPFALDARIVRGAHDNPVFFLHPKALDGALVEFEGIDPFPPSEQA